MENFDYVIVGGGTAAGVLAYRLGEQGHTVCVLEAGPSDRNPYIRIPAGWFKTLQNPTLTWQMKYAGSAGTNDRSTPLVGGRTLGGSSAVNGAVYNRGQPLDYDTWAEFGNAGWSYEDVLPYFRKTEHFYGSGDPRYRGDSGLLPVTTTSWRDIVGEQFLEGATSLGIPFNEDYNGERQTGISYVQSSIYRNRRWSTAHAFLHPARRRFGVRVITNAEVTRIILDEKRATGVSYRAGGGETTSEVRARRGVVVCAGAIGSPKLLQHSGIGPGGVLSRAGVAVQHELSGVGENLRDHYVARVVARANRDVTTVNERVRGIALAREVVNWALGRPSVLALSPVLIYGFWKSQQSLPTADFALSYFPASYKAGLIGFLDSQPGLTCGGFQLRPESRGYVRITSASHLEAPEIQPNFLDHETDQQVLVASLKCARAIMRSEAMRSLVKTELLPGPDVNSDEEWLSYARQYGGTAYHVVGTCKMGPATDPGAVVDQQLRVHGLDDLYVMDASVMPTLPSANTAAATMMIAEKGADMLLRSALA